MIAVLFEADVTPAKQARYLALAAELRPLLDDAERDKCIKKCAINCAFFLFTIVNVITISETNFIDARPQ